MVARYEGCIPRNLRDAYISAVTDDQLLCLRDDFALLQARQIALVETLEANPAPPWADVLAAASAGDMERVVELARAGVSVQLLESTVWTELRELIQEKSKVSALEAKRVESLHLTMTREDAMKLVAGLIDAVTQHVKDPDTIRAIERSIGQIAA